MRTDLIAHFRPSRDEGYTYKELIALRTAGKDFPDSWIIRARRNEDADAQDKALADALAADLAAAEKARAKELSDKDKTVLPKLRDMAEELAELKTDAEEKRTDALAAVKAYRDAYRTAAGKHGAIHRTVKAEYGAPVKDQEGNAQSGQVYTHWVNSDVYLKDERITAPILAPELDTPLFRGL